MEGNEAMDDGEDNVEQLQASETLIDRGVDDVLDEGYVAPDNWSPAQGYGNTREEMRQGESLDMRVKQEEPDRDPNKLEGPWNPEHEDREVGGRRAGRLVKGDATAGEDVGISGGAASAEEAAMHIIVEGEERDD